MIKLIATDLDGTLMSPDHLTVSERTKTALKTAHSKGIKIAIATGRPMAIISDVIEQVPFVDYVIYANGACVYDMNSKDNIYENMIDNTTALEICEYFLQYPVFFEVYMDGAAHYQFNLEEYFTSSSFPQEFLDRVKVKMIGHQNILDAISHRDIEKITLYSVKEEVESNFRSMLLSKNLSVASSFRENLEATSISANKGIALSNLCSELKITNEECMAFGDEGNDCEMLEFAKFSFAMGNASEQCKNAAKYVTLSNAEDGLAVAVEKYAINE